MPPKTRSVAYKRTKALPTHPPYNEMVVKAINATKERGVASQQKILKYIHSNYKVSDGFETHIKLALKRGVANGLLVQPKGTGASGSFKVAKPTPSAKTAKPVKKATTSKPKNPATKKPAAKTAKPIKKATTSKPKKPATKKPAAAKKTSVKKQTTGKKTKGPKKVTASRKPSVKKQTTETKKNKAKSTPKKQTRARR